MKKHYWYKGSPGFSLIELIVVMVIMAIAMAIAIPGFIMWKPNYELRRAARDVFSKMQLTKLEAIKRNQNMTVVFNPVGLSYQYPEGAGMQTINLNQYSNDITFGTLGTPLPTAAPIPIGDGVTYTADQVTFQPRGTVSEIGFVYLRNAKGTSWAVGTDSTVGALTIRKWSGAAWE